MKLASCKVYLTFIMGQIYGTGFTRRKWLEKLKTVNCVVLERRPRENYKALTLFFIFNFFSINHTCVCSEQYREESDYQGSLLDCSPVKTKTNRTTILKRNSSWLTWTNLTFKAWRFLSSYASPCERVYILFCKFWFLHKLLERIPPF